LARQKRTRQQRLFQKPDDFEKATLNMRTFHSVSCGTQETCAKETYTFPWQRSCEGSFKADRVSKDAQESESAARIRILASAKAGIETVFRRELVPETIWTSNFPIPSIRANSATSVSFAFPFSGGAAIRARRAPSRMPPMIVFEAPGTTFTATRSRPELGRIHELSAMRFLAADRRAETQFSACHFWPVSPKKAASSITATP
jgi:hypothetical protein